MYVKIKVAIKGTYYAYETNVTIAEWDLLTDNEKADWLVEATSSFVESWAETGDGELL